MAAEDWTAQDMADALGFRGVERMVHALMTGYAKTEMEARAETARLFAVNHRDPDTGALNITDEDVAANKEWMDRAERALKGDR